MILQAVGTCCARFYNRLGHSMVVLLFVLAAQSTAAQVEETLMRARIEHPQPTLLSSELAAAGYDVLEGSLTASTLDVVVSSSELDELQARGLLIIEIELGRPLQEIYPFSDGSEDIPNGYQNLNGINDRMDAIAAAFPDIAQVVDLTETYNTPATVDGRHLYALKISDNVQMEEDEPALMVVSNSSCARDRNTGHRPRCDGPADPGIWKRSTHHRRSE